MSNGFCTSYSQNKGRFFCADQAYLCRSPAIGRPGGQDPQVAQIAPVLLRVSSWTSSGRGSKWAVIAAVASPGSRLRNSASRLTASHIQGAALKINSCHFCPTDDSACMKISVIIASYLVRTGTMELQFWSWDGGFVRVQANFAEQNLLQNQNRISTLKAV